MFLKGKHSDLAMLSLEDELMSLERMVEVPPLEDLICISQKCRKEKNLECAKRLHSHICNNKLETHGPLGNYLVPMFVECASLSDAEQVFDRLPHRNKYSWNSLIQGYIECGESEQALDLFQQMQELSVHPNAHTLQALLKACARGKWLETGQGVHAVIAKEGFEMEPFVCGTLVDMYAKCGALAEAQEVFGGLPTRDIVLWTALIAGYVEHGLAEEALNCSREMQLEGISPDAVTFVCTLKACGNIGAIDRGREIHAEICLKGLEKGTIVGSTVVDMYAKCRSLAEAQEVFDGLLARDVVSWTALITCYAECGLGEEVLKCLEHMRLEGISPNAVTYVCSLKTCDSIKTIDKGRELHSEIVKEGFDRDAFVGSSLLDIYAKCGSLAEAQKVFYSLPVQDVVSWTALIAGYAEHGFVEEALNCLEHMRSKGMHPNAVTFVCILKACGSARATVRGQETHNEICKKGFERDSSVWIILVEMYTKCGSFVEAHGVFDELLVRDAASWNVLIVGYVEQGLSEKALECLEKMLLEGVSPNAVTFTHTLKACGSMGDMDRGQEIHAKISLDGFEGNPFVGNALVDMYAKCGSLLNAQEVFEELPVRDVVSWNTLLSGYVEHGHGEEALIHLNQMHLEGIILSSVTFVCSLKACSIVGAIERGQELHAEVAKEEFERDPFVAASLVDVYVKCGFLAEAREVFDGLPVRDVILWTALIAGYAEHGLDEEALECMGKMQLEGVARNSVTCVCGLKACGNLGFVDKGREIHDEIAKKGFERDPFVGSALVDMYAKCVSLAEAREVFDKLASRDIVSWNVLVAGYAENNYGEEVLRFLDQIKEEGTSPNSATYTSCLKACNSLGAIDIGRELHADIIKEEYEGDPCVGRMLVDMYAKCNSLAEAREVFDQLSVRNVASWNALMAAYTDHGLGEETLNCFEMMQLEGMLPDAVTLVCTLKACGCIGAVDKGCEIQMSVSKEDFEGDPVLGNAVVDMYAKCGSLAKAQEVFDKLPARDVVSWSSLLAGYARLGKSDIVFDLFERMEEERIQPDGITFLSILTVCSHVGLVDKGQTFFEVMRRDYGIIPSIEHHNCMLDLFGRTGQLGEVVEFFENKLFQPNIGTWITVLGACQRWGYVELGNHAFECALRLEDKQAAAAFILMSNIHADAHGAD